MACEARSRWLPRICRLRPRSFFPARRRPGPRRGPTLLYRQGWAWPLRRRVPSETRGGLAPAASRDQATVPAPPANPTLEPGSCGSGASAAASILNFLSNPPQTKSARRTSGDPKEGHKETPKRVRLSLPWPWLEWEEARKACCRPSSCILWLVSSLLLWGNYRPALLLYPGL